MKRMPPASFVTVKPDNYKMGQDAGRAVNTG